MIREGQIIRVKKVKYPGDCKLKLSFNDGAKRIIDFAPFLENSLNPLIRKYLNTEEFAKYELDGGDLE